MKELATILLKSLSANPDNVVVEEKVENKKVPQILAQKLSDYLQTEEYEKAEYQSETGIVDRNLKTRFETVIKLAQALSE